MPLQRDDDFLVVSRNSNSTSYKVKFEKIVQESDISDLGNVADATPNVGDVLIWNNVTESWEPGPPPIQAPLFLGSRDCTVDGPAGDETDGQFYLNTGTGTLLGSWGIDAPDNAVEGGELIISDGVGGWTNGGSVGGNPTVLSVTAGDGLKHATGTSTTGAVELEVDTDALDLIYAQEDHDHPDATSTESGFMSAADKTKLDAATAAATPSTLMSRDALGGTAVTNFVASYYDLSGLTELT